MATFSINGKDEYYIDIGTGGKHNLTSWQVAKDIHFFKIIDQSLEDPINLTQWTTPLPKLPEDKIDQTKDEFYSDLETLYVRVKIHVGEIKRDPEGNIIEKIINASSDWVYLGPLDQRLQDIEVTKDGQFIEKTTTDALGWLD